MMQERTVAHKLWLSKLLGGSYVSAEGEFEPNYVVVDQDHISRVNVIGTVVAMFTAENESFSSLTLDDGSATIQLRAFRDQLHILKNFAVGDIALAVARLREYQQEIYLSPEIVKKLDDPNFELLRKAELLRQYGKPEAAKPPGGTAEEPIADSAPPRKVESGVRMKAIEVITQHSEFGVSVEMLAERLDKNLMDAEVVVDGLVKEGLVYQDKPGWYKAV